MYGAGDCPCNHGNARLIPWVRLDTATIPGTSGELRLMQRGAEFSIMIGSNELMNSRLSGSEEALADEVMRLLPVRVVSSPSRKRPWNWGRAA